jgi:hypothetical protein
MNRGRHITTQLSCSFFLCLQGDEGLIELAEGETLPVVDEAGNTLGTLHADGRVLDDAGQEIGMLDEDGNVVLFEQQAAEGEFESCYFVVSFVLLYVSGHAGGLDDAGQREWHAGRRRRRGAV